MAERRTCPAAEAVRKIDPEATIVVESNLSDNAEAFRYLSPLAMDNVVYQVHLYKPYEYTHQGVWGNPTKKDGRPLAWPDPERGWTAEHLRRVLAPVRAFQERHKCRVYVGEFSAASWAPGAESYLRDCIALFEEYGWESCSSRRHDASIWRADVRKRSTAGFAPLFALPAESTCNAMPVSDCETASCSSAARRVRSSTFAFVRTCETRSSKVT